MSDDAADNDERQTARTALPSARSADAALVRQETVVLLVDLVESVRLIRENEAASVRRWADFVQTVTNEILPRHRGVLVKSLGDGLLGRFETVPEAVHAAAAMHRALGAKNAGLPEN
jgi:adenylate cyclase